jgi:hypothetical protein
MRGGAQRTAQSVECVGRLIITGDVREPIGEFRKGLVINAAVCGDTVARPSPQLIGRPLRLRDPDHRDVEMAAAGQRLERRKDLLVREIAGCAEEYERVGVRFRHAFSTGDSRP